MKPEEKDKVLSTISRLRSETLSIGPRDAREAEALLMEALEPLLREDGYEVRGFQRLAMGDWISWLHGRRLPTINIRPLDRIQVLPAGTRGCSRARKALIGAALIQAIDRESSSQHTFHAGGSRDTATRFAAAGGASRLDALQAWTALSMWTKSPRHRDS